MSSYEIQMFKITLRWLRCRKKEECCCGKNTVANKTIKKKCLEDNTGKSYCNKNVEKVDLSLNPCDKGKEKTWESLGMRVQAAVLEHADQKDIQVRISKAFQSLPINDDKFKCLCVDRFSSTHQCQLYSCDHLLGESIVMLKQVIDQTEKLKNVAQLSDEFKQKKNDQAVNSQFFNRLENIEKSIGILEGQLTNVESTLNNHPIKDDTSILKNISFDVQNESKDDSDKIQPTPSSSRETQTLRKSRPLITRRVGRRPIQTRKKIKRRMSSVESVESLIRRSLDSTNPRRSDATKSFRNTSTTTRYVTQKSKIPRIIKREQLNAIESEKEMNSTDYLINVDVEKNH